MNGATSSWTPSVTYLVILVVVEIVAMGILRGVTSHGG
jgi:hypothetical protein